MDSKWHEEMASLKARLAVQHMALCALAQSHPQPAALLEAWRNVQADSVMAAYANPGDPRGNEWLTERVQALSEAWTRELQAVLARTGAVGAGAEPTAPEAEAV